MRTNDCHILNHNIETDTLLVVLVVVAVVVVT